MSQYTDEEKAESLRRARELLAELEARDVAKAAEEMAPPWPRWSGGPSRDDQLFRYGIPLRDPGALERMRDEQEAQERRFEKERVAREAQQAKIQRRQQEEAAMADEAWNRWADNKIAAAIREAMSAAGTAAGEIREGIRAEFRHEIALAVKELRAEFARAEAHERGQILDLPALSSWRRRSSDAA